MYASIFRKKPKVIGKELRSYINYVSYCITGVISLGFSAWIYYSPKRPTRKNLEIIRSSKILTAVLEDMTAHQQREYMYLDPRLIATYKKEREITEKVYETFQEKQKNTAETHEKPKEKQ